MSPRLAGWRCPEGTEQVTELAASEVSSESSSSRPDTDPYRDANAEDNTDNSTHVNSSLLDHAADWRTAPPALHDPPAGATHRRGHAAPPPALDNYSPNQGDAPVPTIVIEMPDSPEKGDGQSEEEPDPRPPPRPVGLLMEPEGEQDSATTSMISMDDQDPLALSNEGVLSILKRGITFMKRKRDRLVDKTGACRIEYAKVSDRGQRFLIDFFTTMLEIKWRYHFLLFSLAFGTTWLMFGLVWWALISADVYLHRNVTSEDYVPCVDGVTDFPTSLLFSIETQHTIGYGTRAITPACPVATCLLMLQSMMGVILECILTGIIFAKMARPKRRAQTIIFSEKAVICQRDGERSLMFRVGDMRKSQILGATIHVMLAERKVTKEGEHLPIVTRDVPVTTETGSEYIFLAWPITIMHKIDEASPLWNLSPLDLLEKDWEFIVVLEGTDEVTGATFQVLSSYLPSEILWGHHLKSLLSKSTGGVYTIDYTHFHETAQLNISTTSARRAAIFYSYDDSEKHEHEELSDISVT